MADNRPAKPFGRPYAPGDIYVDSVTGEQKQVQASGPDVVVSSNKKAKTTKTATAKPKEKQDNSLSGLQKRLSQAKIAFEPFDPIKRPTSALGEPDTVPFEGRFYNKEELGNIIASLEKSVSAISSESGNLKDKATAIKEKVQTDEESAKRGFAAKYTPSQRSKMLQEAKQLEQKASKIEKTGAVSKVEEKAQPAETTATKAPTKQPAATETGTSFGRPVRAAGPTAAEMRGAKLPTPRAGKTKTGGVTATIGAETAGGVTGAADGGGTQVTRGKKGKGGKAVAGETLDLENLKKQYPGYSWVWDLSPEFNDTKQLWADFLSNKITAERFNNLLGQSSWYTDQRTLDETRRIKNRYGDILDGGTLSKLVNESIIYQYKDDELDSAFFTSALQRNVMTGEFVDSRAAKAALASNVANNYRNYAKSMFLSTDDAEVEALLTGKMSEEDFTRTKRQVAQATYKNWADLLNDPAMTMEKIVKPWKDMAAQVLELDPSQVDMTKPQFSVAYAGSPDGKMGAMSLGDWYVKLRSDSTYGWDKTTQAKQEAQQLGYNIAKAFGKA